MLRRRNGGRLRSVCSHLFQYDVCIAQFPKSFVALPKFHFKLRCALQHKIKDIRIATGLS
jgi:hypothetical protein